MAIALNKVKIPSLIQVRRGAISSSLSLESNESIPFIEKDSATLKSLFQAVKNNLLFKHLDEDECRQIFDAMFPGIYSTNDIIIEQGERGEYFYIIERGEVDVYVNNELITSMGECSCFGELALIYGTPRLATIKAKCNIKLWVLFGETYRRILMDSTIKKRNMYEEFLSKVPILETLNESERLTIADSLESMEYKDGDIVVKQGDPSEDFFLIIEGYATVYQNLSESSQTIEIDTLGAGNYFGEIALLCNQTRVATIIARGILKCAKMNRLRFERVLGPIRDILKRNIPQYYSLIDLDHLQTMMSITTNEKEYQ